MVRMLLLPFTHKSPFKLTRFTPDVELDLQMLFMLFLISLLMQVFLQNFMFGYIDGLSLKKILYSTYIDLHLRSK